MTSTQLQAIAKDCRITISGYEQVHGGDINECYCLHTQQEKFFLKSNDAGLFPAMFELETAGLDALRKTTNLIVPQVIQHGIAQDKQWLLLQWIEKGMVHKKSMEKFGAALALMHQQPQPFFGWHSNNYIGSLQQLNTQYHSWADFYTQCRIMPLVKQLFDKDYFSKTDLELAASFCKKAANLFPAEPPALLHGDLWGGNYMIAAGGNAAIFDPAVYCGHREMDLGMTKLFGGFTQSFYDAYREVYPLENGWEQRLPIAQVYPLLVHALLFGGHYVPAAAAIFRKL